MIASQANEVAAVPVMESTSRVPVAALAIELTYACNQSCAYCYNPSRERAAVGEVGGSHVRGANTEAASGEPATELLVARLAKLTSAWDLSMVTLTGGEPTKHPALFPLLDLLKSREIRRQLITNGTLMTSSLARKLAPFSLSGVQITLNGPNAQLHREHVGRDSFDDAILGARTLIAEGVPVIGCIVVTQRNAEHVAAIIETWRGIGVHCVALSRFSPAAISLERIEAWLPRRRDLMNAFAQAQPFAMAGMSIHCTVPVPACMFDTRQFAPVRFGQCAIGSPYQEFALGTDGALRLCTLHAGRLALGRDVLDPDWDLASVPASIEVRNYRSRLPNFCHDCSVAATCLGGCGASVPYRDDGAPRALDPLIAQYFPNEVTRTAIRSSKDGKCLGVEP